MKQISAKFLVIFLVIFLASCAQISDQALINNGKEDIIINVQIADDNEERMKGLMFIEKLDENGGMLFIFEKEDYQAFWMKNTLIPLDMIFINDELQIVDIKNASPCKQDSCSIYTSNQPARYVLEINGGFAMKNSINEGDKITITMKNQ